VTPTQALLDEFLASQPGSAGRLLDGMETEDAVAAIDIMDEETAARALQHMTPAQAAACVERLPPGRVAPLIARLPIPLSAGLLRRVGDPTAAAVLDGLAVELSGPLSTLLSHPELTAGAIMDPRVLTASVDANREEALAVVARHPAHLYYYLYVLDATHRLVGVLDLAELMVLPAGAQLEAVMIRDVVRLRADSPLVSVMAHPAWRDLDALPVVDAQDLFLGVLRHRRIRQLAQRIPASGDDDVRHTLLALGELFWLGLSGLMQGLTPDALGPSTSAPRDGTTR